MLSEESCRDAWSVLTNQPTPHALVVVGLNQRRRWIRTTVILGTYSALGIIAFFAHDGPGTDEVPAWQTAFGITLGGLAVAMMLVGSILSDRSKSRLLRGWSPDLALPPAERKILLDVIARGLTAAPEWRPIIVDVAVRHRRQGWSLLSLAGSLVLIAGMWAGDPDFFGSLLLLAAALMIPTIIWRGLLSVRADRFLRRSPPVAAWADLS